MTQKIIQISAYYPPHLGGQENAVHGLVMQLARASKQVYVFTSSKGAKPGFCQEGLAKVWRFRSIVLGHAPIMPGLFLKLLRTARKDIVHVHIGQAFTPEVVWLASKIKRFKYVAQLHIDFQASGPLGALLPIYKWLVLRPVLRDAAAVIVLNKDAENLVRNVYEYKGKIHVMRNGIDDSFFELKRQTKANQSSTLRLLFVGRLSPQKNMPTLLRALKKLQRPVQLDIAGEGEERDVIEQEIQRLKLDNVALLGRRSQSEVRELYKTYDALVMPSLYEAQPMVLLEALAAKIPIIGTSAVGVGDHIRGAGIVVEPTVSGLAEGIEQFDLESEDLPKMLDIGYQRALASSWKTLLERYEELYAEI